MAIDIEKIQSTVKFGAASEILTSDAYKKAAKLDVAMGSVSHLLNALPALIEASVISDAFITEKNPDKDAEQQAKDTRNFASHACTVINELFETATEDSKK